MEENKELIVEKNNDELVKQISDEVVKSIKKELPRTSRGSFLSWIDIIKLGLIVLIVFVGFDFYKGLGKNKEVIAPVEDHDVTQSLNMNEGIQLRNLKKRYKKEFIAFCVLFCVFFVVLIALIVVYFCCKKGDSSSGEVQPQAAYA